MTSHIYVRNTIAIL